MQFDFLWFFFPCVEVGLPGNLFTDIPSWEANPVYLHQIFTRLTSTTSVSHAKLPSPEPSLFAKTLLLFLMCSIPTRSSLILGNLKTEGKQTSPE